jgi:hypothetical protein
MPLNPTRCRQLLKDFNLRPLFIDELGWDTHNTPLEIQLDGQPQKLQAVAQKRGMVALHCPTPAGERLPEYSLRRKIEQQVAKAAHEHLIVFTDAAQTTQIWQWVKREPGKPAACREHHFHKSQSGEALIQKLQAIAFTLDEEETLVLTEVTRRARAGFDVERVTKRFYEQFQKEHSAFLKFIAGITENADHEWYASVMLNRLMFVYFIQRKGFLDGDRDYLRNRLDRCQREKGEDKFYSFYRYFLLRLFHEGFNQKPKNRAADLEKLLGRIPYLNGGFFDIHELEKPERYGKAIQIPDEAFERIFNYFDQYQWHLDERPLRADNEINPDVLGYIFEKYINQKQMGAYYTKEDITEYIGKNTILPFLFDAARREPKARRFFESSSRREEAPTSEPENDQSLVTSAATPTIWDLLRENPDRYIYAAVKKGVVIPLPKEIEAGIKDVSKREGWNKPANEEFALPTEIWREVVARRTRCGEIRKKLAAGEVRDINDLITLNLDIRQFAQDVIENCEGPELLRAFWHAIEKLTALDLTCGSGAFLFAALNILEPLYEACLDRMEAFVADIDRSGEKHRPEKFSDFRKILERVAAHPNRRYFIFKSIILNNLFGVDIMEEAVEICKLRLFLKLTAQVEPDATKDNLGIEPLPDIDFNIRAGNTLVGYATYEEVKRVVGGQLDFDNAIEKITNRAADLQQTFDEFRRRQTEGDGSVPSADKQELKKRLEALKDELDCHLATDYGVRVSDKTAFAAWVKSHQPFHWFIEFYGILQAGGFDVVIGNPPYVNATKVRKQYRVKNLTTLDCPDIYAWVLERTHALLRDGGRSGMIVPLSLGFSTDFNPCRRLLFKGYSVNWFSSFGRIPSALFNFDVRVRNTIHIGCKSKGDSHNYTTRLHRWFDAARPALFQGLAYASFQPKLWKGRIPKLNTPRLAAAFEQLLQSTTRTFDSFTSPRATKHVLHFKKTAYNWLNFCRTLPPCYDQRGKEVGHTQFGEIYFSSEMRRDLAMLLADGKLMFIYWCAVGDDFHVANWNFGDFPIDLFSFEETSNGSPSKLVAKMETAMTAATQFKLNAGRKVGNYNLAKCRDVTDLSDDLFIKKLQMAATLDDLDLYYSQVVKTDFDDDED